jgi:hypothetical protein
MRPTAPPPDWRCQPHGGSPLVNRLLGG